MIHFRDIDLKIINIVFQAILTIWVLMFALENISNPEVSEKLFTISGSLLFSLVGYWFPSPIQQK